MKYKLKHLSKYCCKPANELEFEAVKMAAKLGGVNHENLDYFNRFPLVGCFFDEYGEPEKITQLLMEYKEEFELIPTLDYCKKLRMTEEEAEKLEDDRVVFNMSGYSWSRDGKVLNIPKGYIAKTNEDGTEVTLHKR